MSRSPQIVQQEMLALSPPGYATDPESIWGRQLLPAATEGALIEQIGEALHAEIDPRSSFYLLQDWQAEFGTDPYEVDTTGMSTAQLQAYLYERLTQKGGQSRAFYIAMAAAFGITITITECRQTKYGAAIYGRDVYCESPNQFQWLVSLPETDVSRPVYGTAQYGDDYGTIIESPVVPLIKALAPAHTQPVFFYTES